MTEPVEPPTSGLGSRVAAKVAEQVVKATLTAKAQSAGHTSAVAQHVMQEFTNHVSDEIRGVLGPLWTRLANDPDTPKELQPLFLSLGARRGQAWAWIGGLVASTGVAGGLGGVFEALLAPTVHATNAALTPAILNPGDAARARATGRTGGVNIDVELAAAGFDADRISVLTALAENNLTPDVVLELLRRNVIIQHDAAEALRHNGYRDVDISRLLALRTVPLSPADAAAAWARSELTDAQTNDIGALSGVSTEDMHIMRALAGQPPSPEELLFAWRRHIIDESDVDRGIIQGPIRNEWIPVIKALQWLPLPAEEAANAVNQGHMSLEDARQAAAENGFKPELFDVIVANAGIPPGPQEALDWVNRELITPEEFRQIFLESRIKNKYIDLYLKARYRFLTLAEIRLLVARGALTREQAIQKLGFIGFTPEDSTAIVDGATAEKTQGTRDLSVTQVLGLRAEGLISPEDASAMLGALGYDEQEVAWIEGLADVKRVHTFVTAAINRIRAGFVSGAIDESRANTMLDALDLPAGYKDDALALWDIEASTVTKTLTSAQIVAAVKGKWLSVEEGLARLTRQGYGPDDATILLGLGKAIAQPT